MTIQEKINKLTDMMKEIEVIVPFHTSSDYLKNASADVCYHLTDLISRIVKLDKLNNKQTKEV